MIFINKLQRDYKPANPNGRADAVNSSPVVISSEDKASIDSIESSLGSLVTSSSSSAADLGTISTKSAQIADNTSATVTGVNDVKANTASLGTTTDSAAISDTANTTLISLFKRLLQRVTSLIGLFPTSLTGSGNFKTSVQEPLPSGTNNIGDVDVLSLPSIPTGTNSIGQVTANAGTNLNTSALALDASVGTTNTSIGATNESAASTDTSTSGLNGLIKRLLQRITTLIGLFPSTLSGAGNFKTSIQESLPTGSNSIGQVTANAGTNLDTSALALEETQVNQNTLIGPVNETSPLTDTAASGLNGRLQRIARNITSLFNSVSTEATLNSVKTNIGAVNETAPGDDTASSGLNGRLQRIAQRLSSLINIFPNGLTVSGNFKTAINESIPAGTNYVGKVRLTDGTRDATLLNLANAKPLPVAVVDASGNQITSFSGGGAGGATTIDDIGVMVKATLDMLRHPPYMNGVGQVRLDISQTFPISGTLTGVNTVTGMGAAAMDQSFSFCQQNNLHFSVFKNRVYGY